MTDATLGSPPPPQMIGGGQDPSRPQTVTAPVDSGGNPLQPSPVPKAVDLNDYSTQPPIMTDVPFPSSITDPDEKAKATAAMNTPAPTTPYSAEHDPEIGQVPKGRAMVQKMLDAGAPPDQVAQWKSGLEKKMMDAGAPGDKVRAYFGDTPPKPAAAIVGTISRNLQAQPIEVHQKIAQNPWQAIAAGLDISDVGLMKSGGSPATVLSDNPTMAQKVGEAVGQFVGDLPFTAAGGVIGGVVGGGVGSSAGSAVPGVGTAAGAVGGTVLGAGYGSAALPEAVRQAYLQHLFNNPQDRSFASWFKTVAQVAIEANRQGLAGAAAGAVFGPASKIMGRALGSSALTTVAATAASVGAATSVGAALEGRTPTWSDFFTGTAVGLGFAGTHYAIGRFAARSVPTPVTRTVAQNNVSIYKGTGMAPGQVEALANWDAGIRSEQLGPKAANGQRVTPGIDRMREPDPRPWSTTPGAQSPAVGPQAWNVASHWILRAEGGLTSDTGGLTKYGISAKANPGVDIANLTPQDALNIYRTKYWDAISADHLPPDMRVAAFDAAVNQGVGWTKEALEQSNGNLQRFMDLRRDHYAHLIAQDPEKYGQYAKGWSNRLDNLSQELGAPRPDDLRDNLVDYVGQGDVQKGWPQMGEATPPQYLNVDQSIRDFLREGNEDIATKHLPNGERIPAPEEIGSHLQEFGRRAGIQFHVTPELGEKFISKNGPSYRGYTYTTEDGQKYSGHVTIPNDNEELMRRYTGLGRSEILYHEVGHAIDNLIFKFHDDGSNVLSTEERAELIAASQKFAPKLWAKNPAYRQRNSEMMADGIAAWLSNPTIRDQMPLFAKRYGHILGAYQDIVDRTLPKRMEDGSWEPPPSEDAGQEPGEGGGGGGKPPFVPGQPPFNEDGGRAPRITGWRKSNALIEDDAMSKMGLVGKKAGIDWKTLPRRLTDSLFGTNLTPHRRLDRRYGLTKPRDGVEMNVEDMGRMVLASDSMASSLMLHGGLDAITREKTNDHSIPNALRMVTENGGDLKGFITYWAHKDTLDLAERGVDTPFDPNDAKLYTEDPENIKKYDAAMKEMQAVDRNKLDYQVQSGMLSEAQRDALIARRPFYMDLHRIMDDKNTATQMWGWGVRNPIQSITGSKEGIVGDPISTRINNIRTAIRLAEANKMWGGIIHLAQKGIFGHEQLGLKKVGDLAFDEDMQRILKGEMQDADGKPLPPETANDPDVRNALAYRVFDGRREPGQFLYFNEGKPEVWSSKYPEIESLMTREWKPADSPLGKLFQGFAAVTRAGIMADPAFDANVLFHASMENAIFAPDSGLRAPAMDLIKAASVPWLKNERFEHWLRNGGATRMQARDWANPMLKEVHELFERTGTFQRVANVFPSLFHAMEAQRANMQAASSIGRMEHLTENAGFTPQKAAMTARKTYLDPDETFNSSVMNYINRLVPFRSIGFKDITQVASALRDYPVPTLARAAMYMTGPTIALRVANYIADQKLPEGQRYSDLPFWLRASHFVMPQINGVRMSVRRPYVGGFLFSTVIEDVLDHWMEHDEPSFKEFASEMAERMMPPVAPPLINTAIETTTNHSFLTGRPLIPDSLAQASGYMQYTPATNPMAVEVARLLHGTHIPAISNASAIDIDDWMRNTMGTLPYKVAATLGSKLTGAVWNPAVNGVDGNPYLQGFFVRKPGLYAQSISEFYDNTNTFINAHADAVRARKIGQPGQLSADDVENANHYKEIMGMRKAMGGLFKTLDAINQAATISEEDEKAGKAGLTNAEKIKMTDSLAAQGVAMAKGFTERMSAYAH